MADRYPTSPLGEEPGRGFTLSDATLLAFLGTVALALGTVMLLGALCVEHRIAAALRVF